MVTHTASARKKTNDERTRCFVPVKQVMMQSSFSQLDGGKNFPWGVVPVAFGQWIDKVAGTAIMVPATDTVTVRIPGHGSGAPARSRVPERKTDDRGATPGTGP